MKKFYIILIIGLVLALTLAIQNHDTITLKFIGWEMTGSEALFIIITFFIGLIVGIAAMYPSVYKHRSQKNKLQRQVDDANKAIKSSTETKL